MIAACPKCSARYRIESGRLRPEGVRLRCSHCEAVFRVRPPAGEAGESVAATPAAAQPPVEPGPPSREQSILVADPDVERGKSTANALVDWGLQPTLVHDGVEAMLTIQRLLPRAIVIDAALPRMFGFQICEIVKRNESLREIQVVLVGAIHNESRYRRSPNEIYGADAYIEQPALPEGLRATLQGLGVLADSTAATGGAQPAPESGPMPHASAARAAAQMPEPVAPVAPPVVTDTPEPFVPTPSVAVAETPEFTAPVSPPPVAPVAPPIAEAPEPVAPVAPPIAEAPEPVAPAPPVVVTETPEPAAPVPAAPSPEVAASPSPAPADESLGEEVARAERLARIIVSDIILYNQEKFDAAVQAGDVVSAMEAELAEGRSLFVARIDPSLREQRDFLADELLRVASLRSES